MKTTVRKTKFKKQNNFKNKAIKKIKLRDKNIKHKNYVFEDLYERIS